MHEDLKWFIGFLLIFALIWLAGGGPFRSSSFKGPFIKPLPPVGTGRIYGPDFLHVNRNGTSGALNVTGNGNTGSGDGAVTSQAQIAAQVKAAGVQADKIQQEIAKLEQAGNYSPLRDKLTILQINTRSASIKPSQEYVEVRASAQNTDRILLTGLRLESAVTGTGADIKSAVYLPFQGQVNATEPVYLGPGEVAYIYTGRSPIGYSFRLNKCAGYFDQFQQFTPALPIQCPAPNKETLPVAPNNLDDACLNYLDGVARCRIVTAPPPALSFQCKDYLVNKINYPTCVANHKNDSDFYSHEWRLYLERDTRLWKTQRELIHLVDQNGKLIDVITY